MLPRHRLLQPTARSLVLAPLPCALLWALACRAPAVPHPEITGCHPACPGARTVAIGDAGASLRGAPAQALPRQAAGVRPPSAAAYLCPMHLHVGAAEPGRCPECGMALVARGEALEHDHGD